MTTGLPDVRNSVQEASASSSDMYFRRIVFDPGLDAVARDERRGAIDRDPRVGCVRGDEQADPGSAPIRSTRAANRSDGKRTVVPSQWKRDAVRCGAPAASLVPRTAVAASIRSASCAGESVAGGRARQGRGRWDGLGRGGRDGLGPAATEASAGSLGGAAVSSSPGPRSRVRIRPPRTALDEPPSTTRPIDRTSRRPRP